MDMNSMSMSGMTMTESPTPTMPGMSMSSPTSTMDMPMSGMSTSSMMGMSSMAMTFFTSTTTPLFSMSWTPSTTGQYAGTCIFLIFFAAIFRSLLAVRFNFYEVLGLLKHRRGEFPYVVEKKPYGRRPWRANEMVLMSSLDVVLAGVGYLLMIAVMTMNVGYFLSVLGGVFLGSMVFGRFMAHSAAH